MIVGRKITRLWQWQVLCASVLFAAHDAQSQQEVLSSATPVAKVEVGDSGAPDTLGLQLDLRELLISEHTVTLQCEGDVWLIRPSIGAGLSSGRRGKLFDASGLSISKRSLGPSRQQRSFTDQQRSRLSQGGGRPHTLRATRPERELLLLPFIIAPSQVDRVVDANTVKVRGAKFVAWKLSPLPSDVVQDHESVEGAGLHGLPPGTPTFARKMTVEPSGKLRWRLVRRIRGGQLKDTDSGYDLKINPKRLITQKLGAGAPPQRDRGGRTREAAAQYRQALAHYNRRVSQLKADNAPLIRKWNGVIRQLPESFAMSMPDRIWAVFEVTPNIRDLVITSEMMPNWRIAYEHLKTLREAAGVGRSLGGLDDTVDRWTTSMRAVAASSDARSQRLVAMAVAQSELIEQTQINDGLFKLLGKMIVAADFQARQTLITRLLHSTPTEATTHLIEMAVPKMDVIAKLKWLRMTIRNTSHPTLARAESARLVRPRGTQGMPQVNRSGTALFQHQSSSSPVVASGLSHAQLVAQVANKLLEDEEGPLPFDIMVELIAYVRGMRGEGELEQFAQSIGFTHLKAVRRDAVIAGVLEHAGSSQLAAWWVDKGLLAQSAPRDLQRRTLQMLAHAIGWHDPFTTMYGMFADVVFGSVEKTGQATMVKIMAPITIHSAQHSLYRALQHGDLRLRELAWEALNHFVLPSEGRDETGANHQNDPLTLLLSVNRAQNVSRWQLVEFLRRQSEVTRTTEALVLLAADVDSANSKLAVHALVGSKRPLTDTLASLSDVELHQFAQSVYQWADGSSPLVTGLMRSSRRTALAGWFANQITAGRVPRLDQWASEFGDIRELLALVLGNDPVLALGAAAALAGSVGGNDDRAIMVAEDLRALDKPDPDQLKSSWDQLRGEILVARMEKAAGSYRLNLRIYATGEAHAMHGPTGRPSSRPFGRPSGGLSGIGLNPLVGGIRQRLESVPIEGEPQIDHVLGLIEISVVDGTVYLGNKTITASVHKDHLAIVIDQPQDLKNLAEDLGKLELENVGSLELVPDRDAGWRGVMRLDDGRTAELLLIPDST